MNNRNVSAALALGAAVAMLLLEGTGARAQTYTMTTLANLSFASGGSPYFGDLLMDSTGNLYGGGFQGGANNAGVIFKVAAGTDAVSTLAVFNRTNGSAPNDGLVMDAVGNLYGTTVYGGNLSLNNGAGDGTVFKIAAGTNLLTTIATFNGTNGQAPDAGLVLDSSGNLYGMTGGGGGNGDGTVFKVSTSTNTLSTVVSFNIANGATPVGGLTMDAAGNLYGTTNNGGDSSGNGTVFKIASGTNNLTTLATLSTTAGSGRGLYGSVTLDSAGDIYATTYTGGVNNDGAIVEIAAGTSTIVTLASFDGANGTNPYASLTLDKNGNLFGTTVLGGANNDGTVFEFTPGVGVINTIATLNGSNGGFPYGGLTLDSNGNLYGTTYEGGATSYGTVFKLSASAEEPDAMALTLPALITILATGFRRRR